MSRRISALLRMSAYLTGLLFLLPVQSAEQDPYLWLEEIDGEKALSWVRTANSATDKTLGADPLFKELYQQTLETLNKKDKLPEITLRGNWVYNFYRDKTHIRGIYRRSSLDKFKAGSPDWQTVLDIDQLSAKEQVKWVFQGMDCLKPEYRKCLVRLSRGGGDAVEMREFDMQALKFAKNGFQLPESKMSVSWQDEQHLFVATDFGEGSMTDSGYPRTVKLWQRGKALASAKSLLTVDKKSVWVYATRYRSDQGNIDLLVEGLDFWNSRYYQLLDGKLHRLYLPATAEIVDAIDRKLVVVLKEDWSFNSDLYRQGSVLLIEPRTLREQQGPVTLLTESTARSIVDEVVVAKGSVLVTTLENVKSRVYRHRNTDDGWLATLVDLPQQGKIEVETSDEKTGEFFVRYEDFLTPPTLYSVSKELEVGKVMQQSATFDGSKFKVEQYFAKSADGTSVPYFVVMSKTARVDGKNPTHIFSYGGFRASLTPSYSGSYEDHNGAYGRAWLERGGVFVLANIRGGGEFGPAWHAAALRENRIKSFEDFEAVAEDLITRKITSAKQIGIEGRSNGGLLVGATMIRRPDLYGAVVCGVPLSDMRRYHRLLAGASWMAEFGNPDTDDWSFIRRYSPYQNLNAKVQYPPVFFFTSTRDDRVHPAHARKMVARMKEQGHQVDYYENIEGGHKGSATNEQTAKRIALSFTHLWRHLKSAIP